MIHDRIAYSQVKSISSTHLQLPQACSCNSQSDISVSLDNSPLRPAPIESNKSFVVHAVSICLCVSQSFNQLQKLQNHAALITAVKLQLLQVMTSEGPLNNT